MVLDSFFDSSLVVSKQSSFEDLLPKLDFNNISMIAHSRGGGIATIFCASEQRVKKLVLLASISDFGARQPSKEVMNHWKEEGVIYVENGRTKQSMPMNYNFVEVYENNINLLNIKSSCEKMIQPTLVIQGLADEVVPALEAESLVSWLKEPSSLFIENSDHVFGSCHPYNGTELPGETHEVVTAAIEFLLNN
mgnify:CR=1 FL=1